MPEAGCEYMKIALRMELQNTSKTLPNHRVYVRVPCFCTTWPNDISKWLRSHAGTFFEYMETVLGRTHQKHSQIIAFTCGNNVFARTMPGPPSWHHVYIGEHKFFHSMPWLSRLSVLARESKNPRVRKPWGNFAQFIFIYTCIICCRESNCEKKFCTTCLLTICTLKNEGSTAKVVKR